MLRRAAVIGSALLLAAGVVAGAARSRQPTLPSAGLSVRVESAQTCDGLGRCQGVSTHDGFAWLYGDALPVGVIRQYAVDRGPTGIASPTLRYTGLQIALTVGGRNVINHPTGLTWHPRFGCYLGNTVTATRAGTIYHLDWPRAVADRTLDHAVINATADDLAVQGCRPEFVRHGDRWLLATADYGCVDNAVRLYDPARLAAAARTSDAGVLVQRFPCGPWVQNLHWVDDRGLLVLVQNQTEGRRWRLTPADPWATPDLRRLPAYDGLSRTDELEGFAMLDAGHAAMVASSSRNNVTVGVVTLSAAAVR